LDRIRIRHSQGITIAAVVEILVRVTDLNPVRSAMSGKENTGNIVVCEGNIDLPLGFESAMEALRNQKSETFLIKSSLHMVYHRRIRSIFYVSGNEIFDVHKQPLQSDFNHLFIRQGTGKSVRN
jgi:hypothetical protein